MNAPLAAGAVSGLCGLAANRGADSKAVIENYFADTALLIPVSLLC
jgi:hypothetical protein